jgi:glycosyltransferase involved in cell wall biosynthesis
MAKPSITVVVPNYNHAQFLPRCLSAILAQTWSPDEVLVIDDASTDNSREVLADFQSSHPTVRVLHNETNLRVNRTLNRGLELARSDFVFFTAADDEVRPGLLEASLNLLQQHPTAGLSNALCEWRSPTDGMSWISGLGMPNQPAYLSPNELTLLARRGRLTLAGPSAVYRRSALLETGGWIPDLNWFSDWYGAYVTAFRDGVCHVPEVLSVFNLSPTSYYHSNRSPTERRETLSFLFGLLTSKTPPEVTARIAASGMLGGFGPLALRVALAHPARRQFLNWPFAKAIARRSAEIFGRRWLPRAAARACLKLFFRASPTQLPGK